MHICTYLKSPYTEEVRDLIHADDFSPVDDSGRVPYSLVTLIRGYSNDYDAGGADSLRFLAHTQAAIDAFSRKFPKLVFIPGNCISISAPPFYDWLVLASNEQFEETSNLIRFNLEVTRIANIVEEDRIQGYPYKPNQFRKSYYPVISIARVKCGLGEGYARLMNEGTRKNLKSAMPINQVSIAHSGCIFYYNMAQAGS